MPPLAAAIDSPLPSLTALFHQCHPDRCCATSISSSSAARTCPLPMPALACLDSCAAPPSAQSFPPSWSCATSVSPTHVALPSHWPMLRRRLGSCAAPLSSGSPLPSPAYEENQTSAPHKAHGIERKPREAIISGPSLSSRFRANFVEQSGRMAFDCGSCGASHGALPNMPLVLLNLSELCLLVFFLHCPIVLWSLVFCMF